MKYYQCEQCGAQTQLESAVHINSRMRFDTAFGTFREDKRIHCCGCTEKIGGQVCDHEAGLWT